VPEVIAHRGDSAHAPENTLRAFRRAVERGADRIELDVRRSADGVPFVFHDSDLARLTGRAGRAGDLTLDELTTLQVLADEFGRAEDGLVPSLDAVLADLDGTCPLYVEIKPDDEVRDEEHRRALTDACIERIDRDGPHVLASFDPAVVRRCLDAGRPTVLIAADPQSLGRLTDHERDSLHAYSVLHERIDAALVESCAAVHLPLWAWTVDRRPDFDRLWTAGARTAWCTNDVGALRAWLDGADRR